MMERHTLLNDLALVESQVALDQEHVRRQWQIVVELEDCGQIAIQARQLLLLYENTLEIHVCQRRRIRDRLALIDRNQRLRH